jgi:starch synthase
MSPHVVMLASENDALVGGKVGGVADVVRDLPIALAGLGWKSTVITPSYGFLHKQNPSRLSTKVAFPFHGKETSGELYEVTAKEPNPLITHLVMEHPELRGEPIYSADPPGQAYAADAAKYSMFCSAVGQYIKQIPAPDVVHLHDWHAGFYFLLRELHPAFAHLKKIRSVFTIHNLAYQGNRPVRGPVSSVEQWFPELLRDDSWVKEWKDPRYPEPTLTAIAAGVRFADRMNTVSPSYAREILMPSDHKRGYYGGEGLEKYLQLAEKEHRLTGILNGLHYPADRRVMKLGFAALTDTAANVVSEWHGLKPDPLHPDVLRRLATLRSTAPAVICTSITRAVEQKVRLYFEKDAAGITAMDNVLKLLAANNGVYFFLGNGTPDYEKQLTAAFKAHPNFVYLKGYSDLLAQALYANGTIFMMPSSFEPCGIGQMIAMRDGQPPVVHATGGLGDTVKDGVTGFTFGGGSIVEQVEGLVGATRRAVLMAAADPSRFAAMRETALQQRFTWEMIAREYAQQLYAN